MKRKRSVIVTVERLPDGRFFRIWPDGRRTRYIEAKPDLARLDRLSDAELTRAAEEDPDNPPLTARDLHLLVPVDGHGPRPAALRRRAKLSQAAFAKLIGVSVGTLRGWEQGRRMPTGPARALLRLLARRPELIREALQR
ncbi:MAG: helix-turn-helix domain-containing protein [Alphaproteobacteria bacterium]|nr:helix-turn-helix domain-containing protein [Alphaproteobacteria bacterium]